MITEGVLEERTQKLGLGEQAALSEADRGGLFGGLKLCLLCPQWCNEGQVHDCQRAAGREGGP